MVIHGKRYNYFVNQPSNNSLNDSLIEEKIELKEIEDNKQESIILKDSNKNKQNNKKKKNFDDKVIEKK